MTVEKPLNLEQFFITRNELASRHAGKLELQAMARVRKTMVELQAKQTVEANTKENKKK